MGYVRNYKTEDYNSVIDLYKAGNIYGGQFDPARDSLKKLSEVTKRDPESILVYSDPSNENLNERYSKLGMFEGGVYRCFWEEIK